MKEAAEISWRAAEGSLDAVAEAGVATVEDFVEEIIDKLNHAFRQLSGFESFDELFSRDIDHI